MDQFESHVTKDVISSILEFGAFEINNIKYAVVLSKFAWYGCRIYCSYRLKVHKHSPLYKAIKREKFAPWTYSFKYKTEDSFVFEKVILKRRSQHMTLHGAKAQARIYRKMCENGTFDGQENYPEYFSYFSQFAGPEQNLIQAELEELSGSCPVGFEFNKSEIINQTQADKLIDGLLFPEKTIVKKMRINDMLNFNFYGIPSIVIYSRTFYHIEGVPYSDGNSSMSLHHKIEYSYKKTFCCYLKSSNDKLDLLKKSDDPDMPFLRYLLSKQWEFIFEPKFFYNTFSTTFIHKRDWKNMTPDELNSTLQVGSILRLVRNNGVYYHAGVYLGWDLVIHVSIRKGDFCRKREIFTFDTFENFIKSDTEVEEIRFLVSRFDREELYDRALKMNKEQVAYKLIENNCEHLASLLVTGLKYSLQLGNPVRKFFAQLVGESLAVSHS